MRKNGRFLRRAKVLDGHLSANLYNAMDNLATMAQQRLERCEDVNGQEAAALRGKLRAYWECRKLLMDSRRYRPALLGDPPLSPLIVTDPDADHSRAYEAAVAQRDQQRQVARQPRGDEGQWPSLKTR